MLNRIGIVSALILAIAGSKSYGQLKTASAAELAGDVRQMQMLTAACEAAVESCDAKKVANDAQVGEVGKTSSFDVHWDWLHDSLTKAREATPDERSNLMQESRARLDEMSAEIGAAPAQTKDNFKAIRVRTDAILAGDEFQNTIKTTWWDRLATKFWAFVRHILTRLSDMGSGAWWLAPLIEWGLFIAAAAGLLFFVMRSFKQQRLRISLGESAATAAVWDRESQDWAKLAEASAAQGDWREAIHGLYWAAIIYLEGRRAWRHNPSRTPREYVRLLKQGSAQQVALRGLTQSLERVWYGFGEANSADYIKARALFDGLASYSAESAVTPVSSAEAA